MYKADLVKPPVIKSSMKKKDYNTADIVELVQEVLKTDADDTLALARAYQATRGGLRELYNDVYNRVTYVEDPNHQQWVQTPSFLWHHTRRGDCKSLTVFISSVLQNMNIPHIIRYVSYNYRDIVGGVGKYKHVYPVALLNGREVPMDVVYQKQEGGAFGTEKRFAFKKDILVESGLYKLGSVGTTQSEDEYINQVSRGVAEIEAQLADIPASIIHAGDGDITTMNQGQLERSTWKDRYMIYAKQEVSPSRAQQYRDAALAMDKGTISGIYGLQTDPFGRQVEEILRQTARKTAPAFENFKLTIPAPPASINGLFSKIGDFFKKVGQKIGDAFKKVVNWIWKGPAKSMGAFYLFLFAKKDKVKSPEIRRRIAAQERSFDYIADKGKFSKDALKGIMLNGIKEQTGHDPGQLYSMAGNASKIGALPAILLKVGQFVVKAIGWVIKVVQKIVGLFKKNKSEAGVIDQSTMSDMTLLEEEARLQETKSPPSSGGGSADESSGGGGAIAMLSALAIPLLLRAA